MSRRKTTTKRHSWTNIKRAKAASRERPAGYQEARAAFELAKRVREAREHLGIQKRSSHPASAVRSRRLPISREEEAPQASKRFIASPRRFALELVVELRRRPGSFVRN